MASDERLVGLIRAGHPAAFEALYERYHHPVLSYCRHMLSDQAEAEDVVQHAFLAAWRDLMRSEKPIQLRAWLFAIARNRCLTVLRARREHRAEEVEELATEGLASIVQRRQDLRDLVSDLRRLPEDQRVAIVLAEIEALGHAEIAEVLGVPKLKVKALVFQARESLINTRTARETDCVEIRRQLATEHGGGLRRGHLRRHLRDCSGCREFRAEIQGQRQQFVPAMPAAGSGGAPR
jgi:RNA polymerase sigma factor (sigma-70 family)